MIPSSERPKWLLGDVRRSVLTPGESGVRQSVGFHGSGVRHVVLTNVLRLDPTPWRDGTVHPEKTFKLYAEDGTAR